LGISAHQKFTQSELREIFDVCSRKELTGDWNKIRDILNSRLKKNYNESTYRKRFCAYVEMKNACKDIDPDFTGDTTDVMVQKRELERAKIQFRDERNAWQRQNYNSARVEQKLDYLEKVITESNPTDLQISLRENNAKKTAIITCSDWHIGECFDNEWGCYNSTIARERITEYASKAIQRCILEGVSNVVIAGLGDLVSGNIHRSIAVTNRENVIEQIMLASELMLSFVKAFVDKGFVVTFTNICGNHSRMDKKDEAIKDERMDNLIGWFVSTHLASYPNFKYVKPQDTTLAEVNGFWFVHGDNDNFGKSGLSSLVLAKGYKPAGIFMGHLHSFAVDDCYDVKICRGGSLCGSGNDYTIEKRLKGKPTQLMAIAEDGEVCQFYNIILN
jgi:hypothetical protein